MTTETNKQHPIAITLKLRDDEWMAAPLQNSPCNIHFTKPSDPKDGMMWTAPTGQLDDLEWQLRHTELVLTKSERCIVAGAISSYRTLLFRDAKTQRQIAKAMRDVIKANQPNQ